MPSSLTKGLWFHSSCVSLKEESQQELLPFKGQIRACDVHIKYMYYIIQTKVIQDLNYFFT